MHCEIIAKADFIILTEARFTLLRRQARRHGYNWLHSADIPRPTTDGRPVISAQTD